MSWAIRFQLRQHVRQSLWLVPLFGTVVGAAAAQLDLWLEGRVSMPPGWTYPASTATGLLSAVAGAMIGLLGLVVTIGVLVVQMATGTLSPRFMRLWYRDRLQKLVLGSFTATFAFSFSLLRQVGTGSVPDLGVTLAGIAVTADLILLLLYLDRFVHALRPVAVAAAMARAGLAVLEEPMPPSSPSHQAERLALDDAPPDLRVRASASGAVQAVQVQHLVRLAADRGWVCVLRHAVGDFVTNGGVLVDVYGPTRPGDARRLAGLVALGHERTIDQDPAFAVRIIVDIAIRALSPAVNDPTTATQMINHLGGLLAGIGSHDLDGRGLLVDGAGRLRVVFPTRTWESYLDLGVSEIRDYGQSSAQVCRRLRAMLDDLEDGVLPVNRAAVRRQRAVLDTFVAHTFPDGRDRAFALGVDRQGIGGAATVPGRQHVRG